MKLLGVVSFITPKEGNMQVYQLDFFGDKPEKKVEKPKRSPRKPKKECNIEALEKSFEEVKLSCDKVRKSQFAKIGELNKKILDLESRLAILEANICKGDV